MPRGAFVSPLDLSAHAAHCRVSYADPTATIISVVIITFSAWPLVRDCSWILLQSSPSDVPQYDGREDVVR
jgi:Co/Zn/Cd efflux system component